MVLRKLTSLFKSAKPQDVREVMPRIAVLGNCQAISVADAMRLMLPDAFVKTMVSWELGQWYVTEEDLIKDLRSFDYVFAHDVPLANFSLTNFDALKAHVPDSIQFPSIVFTAFHPDLVYATVNTSSVETLLHSPVGAYNSALVILAYKLNLDVRAAMMLFDEHVYERLGYFDMWQESQTALLQAGKECGLSLDSAFARWSRDGCFMHSINHARIQPMIDVADLLLKKVGVSVATTICERFLVDPAQSDAIWPVYPSVAARFGFEGNYIFKRPNYVAKEAHKFFTLDRFVAESYQSYGFFPRKAISCTRVDAWLQNQELVSWVKNFATPKVRS